LLQGIVNNKYAVPETGGTPGTVVE